MPTLAERAAAMAPDIAARDKFFPQGIYAIPDMKALGDLARNERILALAQSLKTHGSVSQADPNLAKHLKGGHIDQSDLDQATAWAAEG